MKTSNPQAVLLQAHLAESGWGRALLHLLCACQDHKFHWHWRGIRREFSRHATA